MDDSGEIYLQLYKNLKDKNVELINNVEEYNFCHYTPNSYEVIKKITPLTVWLHKSEIEVSFERVLDLVKIFGQSPIILKDYVKSRKHDWDEACFIPDASNSNKLLQVVEKFLELQSDDLNEGLVFKEFLNLEFLSYHPQSGSPLSKEFRIFFLDGKPIITLEYWDEGIYGELKPDLSSFIEVAKKINSRFFTMDIAKIENGPWIILELGDGQVAGLPNNADVIDFYNNIKISNIQ
ncbi:MAG: ATP-grasp domain-containing protein [Bacillota bacterium]